MILDAKQGNPRLIQNRLSKFAFFQVEVGNANVFNFSFSVKCHHFFHIPRNIIRHMKPVHFDTRPAEIMQILVHGLAHLTRFEFCKWRVF